MNNKITLTVKGFILSFCLFISTTAQAQFKVIGYLTNWGSFVADAQKIDYSIVNHVNIAFINPSNSTGALSPTANLTTVTQIIHTNNAVAIGSLGGATASTLYWSTLIAPAKRTGFISKLLAFTLANNLDGLDVDLEGNLITSDYNGFVQELCDTLHAHNKLVTTAIGTWQGNRIDDLTLEKYDLINVMSYDYYGTWTGPGQHSPYSGSESELNYWTVTRNVPKEKIILGLPSYGYLWQGATKASMTYTQIVNQYPRAAHQDSINTVGGGVIYYNGIETIKEKTVLALAQSGGIMMWTLQNDFPTTNENSLIRAISEVIQSTIPNSPPVVNLAFPLNDTTLHEGDSLFISANASDSDGNITRVSFYYDNTKISESTTDPYQTLWKNIGPGTFKVFAKAIDNGYTNSNSDTITVTVLPSTVRKPFGGKPWDLPGKIEAENFDIGDNLGFYDTDAANNGGSYRTGSVDIESCSDSLGGYDIGWTSANEWLKYTINVTKDTIYQVQISYASQAAAGGRFHIEKNDTNITGSINAPSTTGWQIWKKITINNLKFTANDTVLKFVFEVGDFNVNYYDFKYGSNDITAIEDEIFNNTSNVVLFPNPCENELRIQYELKNNQESSIQIYDVLGRNIYQKKDLQHSGLHITSINTSGFAKGLYQLVLNGNAQKFIAK